MLHLVRQYYGGQTVQLTIFVGVKLRTHYSFSYIISLYYFVYMEVNLRTHYYFMGLSCLLFPAL